MQATTKKTSFFEKLRDALPPFASVDILQRYAPESLWHQEPLEAVIQALTKSGLFDARDYLYRYPDVAQAKMDPIRHFVCHGINEMRSFRPPRKFSAPERRARNRRLSNSAQARLGEEGHESKRKSAHEIIAGKPLAPSWGDKHENLIKLTPRPHVSDLVLALEDYDVISFDVFDTAILRKVEFPRNIFDIIALELKQKHFASIRIKAEAISRLEKARKYGHREVTLEDIYTILAQRYGIDQSVMEREIELEKLAVAPNAYILNAYRALLNRGKTVVFTTDMYLPQAVIAEMLHAAGYTRWSGLYVSNACALRKGDGSMQKKLLRDFRGRSIAHVGDNRISDVKNFLDAGIDSVWNPDCRLEKREAYLNNLSGHIYRAVLNNEMNNGLWHRDLHYTHGFRIGGILTAGFCQFTNRICAERKIDKILFCGRDCYIIQKVYDSFYREVDNSYIESSRFALMMLTPRRYLHDILQRFVFRHWDENGANITLEQLLTNTGFAYLAPLLENFGINKFAFCSASDKMVFEEFFHGQADVIAEHARESIKAAREYFSNVIGEARSLLIADVGWSGTCIEALEIFLKNNVSQDIGVTGALLCASNSTEMANLINNGNIVAYVSSPIYNSDLSNFITPAAVKSQEHHDRLHMPLEYLFTAPTPSLLAYALNSAQQVYLKKDNNMPPNKEEIVNIHDGIFYFNKIYSQYARILPSGYIVPPYTAFIALKNAIKDDEYCHAVYGNFLYDAATAPGCRARYQRRFASFFPSFDRGAQLEVNTYSRKILFATHELSYTGSPHSILRTARVARDLGFEPVVWSSKDGPFRIEFEKENISVKIVSPKNIGDREVPLIRSFDMAYCNTIMTADFVQALHKRIPTVWMIREANNLPDFCVNNRERLELLRKYDKIYCVSEYAQEALAKFTEMNVGVLRNSVEDQSNLAEDHKPGTDKVIRIAQLGTIEYRKGYDVLIAAYKSLPENYKKACELYLAGGFISSAAAYSEYLFAEIRDESNIHFLGTLEDTSQKIRLLSLMDIVVVASRDESCSLVALEGAMLSKPLIVTENVGAKYIVGAGNGIIVPAGDVAALRGAIIELMDKQKSLMNMGRISRLRYEKEASMAAYKKEVSALINREAYGDRIKVIVSMTSHPARIRHIIPCIDSLLGQSYRNKEIHLWLSKDQFPAGDADLPGELIEFSKSGIFHVRWVDGDIKPHKKYYYAIREFTDIPVVTVDDDAIYPMSMLENLVDSYLRHPHAISCHRANLIRLRKDGTFLPYSRWDMDYTMLKDKPSYRLMPTGVGGVLYPPRCMPEMTFDMEAIKELCLTADDLWLKMMAVFNEYPTVVARNKCDCKLISEAQECALWKDNVVKGSNDVILSKICSYIETHAKGGRRLREKIWNGLYAN